MVCVKGKHDKQKVLLQKTIVYNELKTLKQTD